MGRARARCGRRVANCELLVGLPARATLGRRSALTFFNEDISVRASGELRAQFAAISRSFELVSSVLCLFVARLKQKVAFADQCAQFARRKLLSSKTKPQLANRIQSIFVQLRQNKNSNWLTKSRKRAIKAKCVDNLKGRFFGVGSRESFASASLD